MLTPCSSTRRLTDTAESLIIVADIAHFEESACDKHRLHAHHRRVYAAVDDQPCLWQMYNFFAKVLRKKIYLILVIVPMKIGVQSIALNARIDEVGV